MIDARLILEDCQASIRKAGQVSRGEIGELAIGYISALTHDFLGKALEVWRQRAPGIVVDCIEMNTLSQERALMYAEESQIPLALLKEEPFIGLNRLYPNYGDWLVKRCQRVGFRPRIVKEADGAASALAFVAAGFGVAVIGKPLQKIPALDVIFRELAPDDRAWVPVAAAWNPDSVTAAVASKFVEVLAQTCASGL